MRMNLRFMPFNHVLVQNLDFQDSSCENKKRIKVSIIGYFLELTNSLFFTCENHKILQWRSIRKIPEKVMNYKETDCHSDFVDILQDASGP